MPSMKIRVAALALIAAFGASTAHAQKTYPSLFSGQSKPAVAKAAAAKPAPAIVASKPSGVAISQQGSGNGAGVGQNGPANGATIGQIGANNTGQVSQNGANNNAAIHQLGQNNTGAITQTGDNNNACIVQLGRNNAGAITQSGNGNRLGVAQNAARTWEFAPELCDQYGHDPRALKQQVRGYGLKPVGTY